MNSTGKPMMISMRMSLILPILLIAACTQPPAAQTPAELAGAEIDAAAARYEESRAAGHAWLQTSVRLENARQALQNADFDSARAEARQAMALADASLAQARAEESAWRDRFPEPPPGAE